MTDQIAKMSQLQYYLTKLAEECTEVAHRALKAQQFGPSERMPLQRLNNFELCHKELDDLWAMVEELNASFDFGYSPNRERIVTKKLTVREYLRYSIDLGMVQEDGCVAASGEKRGSL